MLKILSRDNSIVNQYLLELRDVSIQSDRSRFERNIERLGMLAGYEVSKLLAYKAVETKTPLAVAQSKVLQDKLVLATVLRAGLPLQRGLSQVFDKAELAFIGAARHEKQDGVEVELGYQAAPALQGKVLVMADVMIATGQSLVESYQRLVDRYGQPARTIIVAVIASQPGLDYVQKHLPKAELLVCAVDPKLNKDFYIVPGLGDAGDLLFGPKLG